ncbi:RlpA-like double-psi beta-barrel domain-containing protein [Kitasatospora cineracea]
MKKTVARTGFVAALAAGSVAMATAGPSAAATTYTGMASFYSTGLGACGVVVKDSDLAVALSPDMFGSGAPGPRCGAVLAITYKGRTVNATVADRAAALRGADIDLSPAAFSALGSVDEGRIQVTWRIVKDAPKPTPGTPKPQPTPTRKPDPTEKPTPTAPGTTKPAKPGSGSVPGQPAPGSTLTKPLPAHPVSGPPLTGASPTAGGAPGSKPTR